MISFLKSENIKSIINNEETNKKTKLSNLFQYIYRYMNEFIPPKYKSSTKEVLKSNNSVHLKIRDNVKLILTLENTNSNYTLSLSMALEYISDNIELITINILNEYRLQKLIKLFSDAFNPEFLYTDTFISLLLRNKFEGIIEFEKGNKNNKGTKFKIKDTIFTIKTDISFQENPMYTHRGGSIQENPLYKHNRRLSENNLSSLQASRPNNNILFQENQIYNNKYILNYNDKEFITTSLYELLLKILDILDILDMIKFDDLLESIKDKLPENILIEDNIYIDKLILTVSTTFDFFNIVIKYNLINNNYELNIYPEYNPVNSMELFNPIYEENIIFDDINDLKIKCRSIILSNTIYLDFIKYYIKNYYKEYLEKIDTGLINVNTVNQHQKNIETLPELIIKFKNNIIIDIYIYKDNYILKISNNIKSFGELKTLFKEINKILKINNNSSFLLKQTRINNKPVEKKLQTIKFKNTTNTRHFTINNNPNKIKEQNITLNNLINNNVYFNIKNSPETIIDKILKYTYIKNALINQIVYPEIVYPKTEIDKNILRLISSPIVPNNIIIEIVIESKRITLKLLNNNFTNELKSSSIDIFEVNEIKKIILYITYYISIIYSIFSTLYEYYLDIYNLLNINESLEKYSKNIIFEMYKNKFIININNIIIIYKLSHKNSIKIKENLGGTRLATYEFNLNFFISKIPIKNLHSTIDKFDVSIGDKNVKQIKKDAGEYIEFPSIKTIDKLKNYIIDNVNFLANNNKIINQPAIYNESLKQLLNQNQTQNQNNNLNININDFHQKLTSSLKTINNSNKIKYILSKIINFISTKYSSYVNLSDNKINIKAYSATLIFELNKSENNKNNKNNKNFELTLYIQSSFLENVYNNTKMMAFKNPNILNLTWFTKFIKFINNIIFNNYFYTTNFLKYTLINSNITRHKYYTSESIKVNTNTNSINFKIDDDNLNIKINKNYYELHYISMNTNKNKLIIATKSLFEFLIFIADIYKIYKDIVKITHIDQYKIFTMRSKYTNFNFIYNFNTIATNITITIIINSHEKKITYEKINKNNKKPKSVLSKFANKFKSKPITYEGTHDMSDNVIKGIMNDISKVVKAT